jgi:hypothetical protein
MEPLPAAEITTVQQEIPTLSSSLSASPSNDEEPYVDVRVGLLGNAIELLELCDELVNHPGHSRIDARLRQIAGPCRHDISGIRWPHEAFAATANELQTILDTAGIIVEPTLHLRTHRHHQA